MKKLLQKVMALLMAFALFNAQTLALSNPFNGKDYSNDALEVINFDESSLYAEFSKIEPLTQTLRISNVSYSELKCNSSADLSMVSSSSNLPLNSDGNMAPPLGIPSFLWGCVFGILGLILVYILTDQDHNQTRKAFWGCVVATLLWGGGLAFY